MAAPLPVNETEDLPTPGPLVTGSGGVLDLPTVVFGAAPFNTNYNTDDYIASSLPLRTVRLALRYGIRAFDTSVFYGPSEIVLGNALYALREEFPRSSYQIITKCGRFGLKDFDYSPSRIRASVKQSLERFRTTYLDAVYLHDVEFVASSVPAKATGDHTSALGVDAATYGLADEDKAKIRGEGDKKVLGAIAELFAMKEEGLIKHVGISGFPLPVLLRIAILVLNTPPFKPLDIFLSYSHLCLQNSTYLDFIPHFYERAKLGQLLSASPLSMALLTPNTPPWHPAPPELRQAARDAAEGTWKERFPNLAIGYSMRHTLKAERSLPLVIGFTNLKEVHECIKVWREIRDGDSADRVDNEERAKEIFQKSGYYNWSWASP